MADTSLTDKDVSAVTRRTFKAALPDLWRAWTDADVIAQWWGPHGFRTEVEVDVRPQGRFSLVMRAADGETYPLQGEYLEVVAQSRLAMEMHHDDHPANWHDYLALQFTKAGGDEAAPPSLTVVTSVVFQSLGDDECRVTVKQTFATPAERDAFDAMGMSDGWQQSFDKLDRVLEAAANHAR